LGKKAAPPSHHSDLSAASKPHADWPPAFTSFSRYSQRQIHFNTRAIDGRVMMQD
jgi:hypothetical protein